MFQMRPEHVDAFERAAQAGFEQRAIVHIRERLPEYSGHLSDDDLRFRVRHCQSHAAAWGLTSERQVFCFIDAFFLLGEGFESDRDLPEARQILECGDPPDDRAYALLEYASLVVQPEQNSHG